MKIGIIGAGHIGGTLTRRLRALGHEVKVSNSRGPRESIQALVSETGATAVEAKDAPKDADLVIVTIPEKSIPQLPKDLFANAPTDLIVGRHGLLLSEAARREDNRDRGGLTRKPLG